MIKFSWKKINDKFGWNPYDVLDYFCLKRNKSPKYAIKNIPKDVKNFAKFPYPKGSCFLRDIDALLESDAYPNDVYMYLELASKRNVFDYHMRGVLYLPLPLVEEYHIEWIKHNPLLEIENNKVYFKYEETGEKDSEY